MGFPHKIWADPELMSEYDKAAAQAKAKNPDMGIPSHLDMRGADHVFGLLAAPPEEPAVEKAVVAEEPKATEWAFDDYYSE